MNWGLEGQPKTGTRNKTKGFFHEGALATKLALIYLKTQNRMSFSQERVSYTASLLRSRLLGTFSLFCRPLKCFGQYAALHVCG